MQPQYDTVVIPRIEVQKGSAFSQLISAPKDLRGAALLGEIRRIVPGKAKLNGFVASVREESNQVRITRYPATASGAASILDQIGIVEGDRITIKGADIINAKVEAISQNFIVIDQTPSRTLSETPFSFRSPVVASFSFVPYSQLYSVVTNSTAQQNATAIAVNGNLLTFEENSTYLIFKEYTSVGVDGLPMPLNKHDRLVFRKNDRPVTVDLSAPALKESTSLQINDLSEILPSGSTAILNSSSMVLRAPIEPGDTTAQVFALDAPVGKDAFLNFAFRDENGWRSVGTVLVAESALENSLEVSIVPFTDPEMIIPEGSVAYCGTAPFRSFYAVLDGKETDLIDTGRYAADIIALRPGGGISRVAQFTEIVFTDNWTDIG